MLSITLESKFCCFNLEPNDANLDKSGNIQSIPEVCSNIQISFYSPKRS